MNDFQFLLPDGSYRTTDQERFSAAYQTGAVPVEALPEVDVMSPSGMLETMHHKQASELIKTQGYKLSTSPRPLRFSSPDGRVGEVKLGFETEAFRRGGTLILKELSDSKPLVTDLPRDPKIAQEPAESPMSGWFGPVPKDPTSLKGWDAYQGLVAKNKKGKAGFWEGVAPTAYNIPFFGVGKEAVDVGKAVLTANRIRDGKAVSDQDVLDLNLYLSEMDRNAKASIGGKVGKVFVDMLTFMAEIGVSTGATVLAGGQGGRRPTRGSRAGVGRGQLSRNGAEIDRRSGHQLFRARHGPARARAGGHGRQFRLPVEGGPHRSGVGAGELQRGRGRIFPRREGPDRGHGDAAERREPGAEIRGEPVAARR